MNKTSAKILVATCLVGLIISILLYAMYSQPIKNVDHYEKKVINTKEIDSELKAQTEDEKKQSSLSENKVNEQEKTNNDTDTPKTEVSKEEKEIAPVEQNVSIKETVSTPVISSKADEKKIEVTPNPTVSKENNDTTNKPAENDNTTTIVTKAQDEKTVANSTPDVTVVVEDDEIPASYDWLEQKIEEHKEEIDEQDLADFRVIIDKINQEQIRIWSEGGFTTEEQDLLKEHLHSRLTESEYLRAKELFTEYRYLLEEV